MSLQTAQVLGAVGGVLFIFLVGFSILFDPLILLSLCLAVMAICLVAYVSIVGMNIAETIWRRYH